MITILFLAANPLDTEPIRLGEECREIQASVASGAVSRIRVESKWAVRPQDLQKALLEFSPALVHFSGHGDSDGQILLESPIGYLEAVPFEAFSDLFRVFSSFVRCVVLNACNSAGQARLLAKFIDCAIGMEGSVSVGAARAFATSFYQALAYGKDVATAFELGRNQISLENLDEEQIPQLYIRDGVDQLFLSDASIPIVRPTASIEAFVRAQLSLTSAALGLSETFKLAAIHCDDSDPPPIVEKCSTRAATVTQIQQKLAERCWYAMHGGIGTGKTHLAVLLARRHTGRCVWLRLRERNAAQALSIVEGTFALIKQRQAGQSKAAWYEECCSALGRDAVLVLDDLPKSSGHEDFDDALVFLGRAIRRTQVNLVTISPLPLPSKTRAATSEEVIEKVVPAFSEDEILELLAAHGAPDAFLNQAWVGTVSAVCRQHPLLLTEAARFLESKEWKMSAQTFQEVMSGQYAINLDAPTQDHLLRTVPNSDTRDLLYRLSVVGRSFSGNDVREIASIAKPLDHPAERLTSLLGLWVQRDSTDRYVVSPLVSRFSNVNLSRETERQVHRYLARRLMRDRPITPLTATQAITHYIAADLYEDAGMVLLSSLWGYLKAKKPKDDFLLSEFWAHTSLPTQMPIALRVDIRTAQILIYQEKRKDSSLLLAELEQLLASERLPPELQEYGVLLGGIAGVALWSQKPADAVRHATQGLQSLRAAPAKILGVQSDHIRLNYYDLLWSATSQIKTEPELQSCLDRLSELNAAELARWAESHLADLAAETLCNTLWLAEHRKLEVERDWNRVLRMLGMIAHWSREHAVTALYAWSHRGMIVVIAEYLNRLDDAIALGQQAIAACAADSKAVFWLRDILGRQYYYAGRWQESLNLLAPCVESPASVKHEERAYVTVLAGINAAKLKAVSALNFLSQAAEIVQTHATAVPVALGASIYTELAFEQWQAGRKASAYGSTAPQSCCLPLQSPMTIGRSSSPCSATSPDFSATPSGDGPTAHGPTPSRHLASSSIETPRFLSCSTPRNCTSLQHN